LHGAIYQDSSVCSDQMQYDVNLLIKDPQNRVHKIVYEAKHEKMESPKLFNIKPNSTKDTYKTNFFTDTTGRECSGEYCTKLAIDPINFNCHSSTQVKSNDSESTSVDESAIPKTLAFVLIDQRFFDPI
jgi:hypothetical protein